jgi:flavin-dependent dehydrogenase
MYDVAIVGAGPSGCVAAKALLQAGMRVAVLEAQSAGRSRTCGGGVLTRALGLLLPEAQPALQRQCTTLQVCFHSPKMSFTSQRERPFVSMVSRAELDASLLEAVKTLGGDVRERHALTGLTQRADHVELETSQGPIVAKMVIAADGVHSLTAQRAGFAALPRLGLGMALELPLPESQLQRYTRAARFDFGVRASRSA